MLATSAMIRAWNENGQSFGGSTSGGAYPTLSSRKTSYYQQIMGKHTLYTLESRRTYQVVFSTQKPFDAFRVVLGSLRTDGTTEQSTVKAFSPPTMDNTEWNAWVAAGNDVNMEWEDPVLGTYSTTAKIPNGETATKPRYIASKLAIAPRGGASKILVIRILAGSLVPEDITIQDASSVQTPFNHVRASGRVVDCTAAGGSALTTFPDDAPVSHWAPIAGVEFFLQGEVVDIMKIGDSLVNGGLTQPYGDGYVTRACDIITAATGKIIEPSNLSFPSAKRSIYGPLGLRQVTDFRPAIVLLETVGPNDIESGMTLDEAILAINDARRYADETRKIAEANGSLVITFTCAPCSYTNPIDGTHDRDYALCDAARIQFNEELRASGVPFIDTDLLLAGTADPTTGQINLNPLYDYDGIHWNDAGVDLVAAELASIIMRYI